MNRRKGVQPRKRRGPSVVLVFGEDLNDSRSMASLVAARCPSLRGRIKPRPRPISLQRSASQPAMRSWAEKVADVVAANASPVACVIVHRDSDAPDGMGVLAANTEAELKRVGLEACIAAVPVQKTEAWWLLFPTATETFRSSWRGTLEQRPGDVELIEDPKVELRRRTARGGRRSAYQEADSPRIAELVAEAVRNEARPAGHSASFDRFMAAIDSLCSA